VVTGERAECSAAGAPNRARHSRRGTVACLSISRRSILTPAKAGPFVATQALPDAPEEAPVRKIGVCASGRDFTTRFADLDQALMPANPLPRPRVNTSRRNEHSYERSSGEVSASITANAVGCPRASKEKAVAAHVLDKPHRRRSRRSRVSVRRCAPWLRRQANPETSQVRLQYRRCAAGHGYATAIAEHQRPVMAWSAAAKARGRSELRRSYGPASGSGSIAVQRKRADCSASECANVCRAGDRPISMPIGPGGLNSCPAGTTTKGNGRKPSTTTPD